MTKLSVNVNKLATIRNARGKNSPDVVDFGQNILAWGAHGLTVHPRPDGRHIRFEDVQALSAVVREFNESSQQEREFNVEGYPSPDFIHLIKEVKPDQVTLVPDPPEALTSNAGWKLTDSFQLLSTVCDQLHQSGTRISLFIDPSTFHEIDIQLLKRLKVERVELYTEAFAESFEKPNGPEVLALYRRAATLALKAGLALNAGHDLNQLNLKHLLQAIPEIEEVSIGHALICEALYDGMQTTVQNYLRILR